MELDIKPKTVDDIKIIENVDGSIAFLDDAKLAEDVALVKKYAEDFNIKYYVAVKHEENGVEKRFAINEMGNPYVLSDSEEYGLNANYHVDEKLVEETEIVEPSAIDEATESISGDIVDEKSAETVETTSELEKADTSDEIIKTLQLEIDVLKGEIKGLKSERDNAVREKSLVEEELARVREELEIANNSPELPEIERVVTLADVKAFLSANGLVSLTIKD